MRIAAAIGSLSCRDGGRANDARESGNQDICHAASVSPRVNFKYSQQRRVWFV
jgi:hypothetical protein